MGGLRRRTRTRGRPSGQEGVPATWGLAGALALGALRAGAAQPEGASSGYGAGALAADDLTCKRGCVDVEEANLVWCAGSVEYVFCNRTASGPMESSVMKHEQTAINAYLAMMQQMEPKARESQDCKTAVRRWMCFELFPRCTADELRVYPVCQSSCLNVFNACGKPLWLNCFLEVEEELGVLTSVAANGTVVQHYDAEGLYVRGSGTAVFERKANKCTGSAPRPRPTAAAFALLALVSLLLAAAAGP